MKDIRKHWIQTGNLEYAMQHDQVPVLVRFHSDSRNKADLVVGTATFTIQRRGFWNKQIAIADETGQVVLKSVSERWRGNKSTISFKNKVYTLVTKETPLTFTIRHRKNHLLTYSVNKNAAFPAIHIDDTTLAHSNPLFDALIWFLLLPKAQHLLTEPDFGQLAI